VLDQSALARQVLSSNMVMVYPNNPNKQKEYEQRWSGLSTSRTRSRRKSSPC